MKERVNGKAVRTTDWKNGTDQVWGKLTPPVGAVKLNLFLRPRYDEQSIVIIVMRIATSVRSV